MALDSWRNVAAPRRLAANNGGALVNPPMPSTASGQRLPKSFFAARYDCAKP
jgi:hypothetical protein